jgi:hypothetical protein
MNGPGPGAHRSGLVTSFYIARYIVGMFIMGFPIKSSLLTDECL